MTREEKAIYILHHCKVSNKDCVGSKDFLEALDMAIEALKRKSQTVQEKQAESEKYQKAYDDGYDNGYAQAKFDYGY